MSATVRFSVSQSEGNNVNYATVSGSSIREALEEVVGIDLSSVAVIKDGVTVENLDAELTSGSSFTVQPKKYSSGC